MNRILRLSTFYSKQICRLTNKSNTLLSHPTVLGSQSRLCESKHEETYTRIYKLPSIKYMSMISNLKKYPCIGTALTLPITGVLEYYAEMVPTGITLAVGYVGVSTGLCLFLASLFFKNTIGMIYVSQDLQNIKVSTLDLWGKRVDSVIPIDDWIPLSELPQSRLSAAYLKTRQYSSTKRMRFFHRNGEVTDKKLLDNIIGVS